MPYVRHDSLRTNRDTRRIKESTYSSSFVPSLRRKLPRLQWLLWLFKEATTHYYYLVGSLVLLVSIFVNVIACKTSGRRKVLTMWAEKTKKTFILGIWQYLFSPNAEWNIVTRDVTTKKNTDPSIFSRRDMKKAFCRTDKKPFSYFAKPSLPPFPPPSCDTIWFKIWSRECVRRFGFINFFVLLQAKIHPKRKITEIMAHQGTAKEDEVEERKLHHQGTCRKK